MSARSPLPLLGPILVVTALCGAVASAAEGEGEVRIIALAGDDAVGVTAAQQVEPTADGVALGIDRAGNALFNGTITDRSSGDFVTGGVFFVGTDGNLRVPVLTGDTVPDTSGAPNVLLVVSRTDRAVLNPGGSLFFEARYPRFVSTTTAPILLADEGGVIRTIAMESAPMPGICTLSTLGSTVDGDAQAFNNGLTAFAGRFDGLVCPESLAGMFTRPAGGPAAVVILEDLPAPGIPGRDVATFHRWPRVNEEGAFAFLGSYWKHSGNHTAVYLVDPAAGGAPVPLAVEEEIAPGTALTIDEFRYLTIDNPASPGGPARVGYAAVPEDSTDFLLYDTAQGSAPFMRTGDTQGPYTFTATHASFQRRVSLALTDGNRVIVVGRTTGPDLRGGEADGVWRFDPAATPPLQLILYEGQVVPNQDNGNLQIQDVFTVNVNGPGRVAVEIRTSVGNIQQILIERSGPQAGDFRVALQQREDVPSRDGPTELVGIANSFPATPRLTGTGRDGRLSRFNDSGLFVFRGGVVLGPGGTRDGVYTITVEEPSEPCDVTARVRGGTLTVTGDEGDCEVFVDVLGGGAVRVRPGANTQVNGANAPFDAQVSGDVRIAMGPGEDHVVVSGAGSLPKGLRIDGGRGADRIEVRDATVGKTLRISTGDGDTVRVEDVTVDGKLQVKGGPGVATVELEGLVVRGKSTLQSTDGDNSTLRVTRSEFGGVTKLLGGSGGENLRVHDSTFLRSLKVDLGPGVEGDLLVENTVLRSGGPVISGKKGTGNTMRLTDVTVERGRVKITGGRGVDRIFLTDCDVEGKTTLQTMGGTGPDLNTVNVTGCTFGRSLVVKGKGAHRVTLDESTSGTGFAINLRGGDRDTLSSTDATVVRGLFQVSSRAGVFEAVVTRATVTVGAFSLRGGNGDDTLDLAQLDVGGRVQVTASGGDDLVDVDGSVVRSDLRLFGGNGADTLRNGSRVANNVTGTVVVDSFEDVTGPVDF